MGAVGFLTFGFTRSVCGKPPNQFAAGTVDNNSVIIHGYAYNLAAFKHPNTGATFNGSTNPISTPGFPVAAQDVSFMFQNVNGSCDGIINSAAQSSIPATGKNPHWYFPCNPFNQAGSSAPNKTGIDDGRQCHASVGSRQQLAKLSPSGFVSYSWKDVINPSRNLAVYES